LPMSFLVAEICQNETRTRFLWDVGLFHRGMKCFHMRFKSIARWQMDCYTLSLFKKFAVDLIL
jgi:hypothetical protein